MELVARTTPAAASASGQTSESARPSPRRARITAQTSSTSPPIRRPRGGAGEPGAGNIAQAPRYATMPAPLAKASSAKTSRTSVGSTATASAMPAHTPATTRSRSTRVMRGSASGSLSGPTLTRG